MRVCSAGAVRPLPEGAGLVAGGGPGVGHPHRYRHCCQREGHGTGQAGTAARSHQAQGAGTAQLLQAWVALPEPAFVEQLADCTYLNLTGCRPPLANQNSIPALGGTHVLAGFGHYYTDHAACTVNMVYLLHMSHVPCA